jgi:hypothetical protein
MTLRKALMWICAAGLLAGVVMRRVGLPHWGWVVCVSGGALAFLFLLPAMGARSREPSDSPSRRVHWGD